MTFNVFHPCFLEKLSQNDKNIFNKSNQSMLWLASTYFFYLICYIYIYIYNLIFYPGDLWIVELMRRHHAKILIFFQNFQPPILTNHILFIFIFLSLYYPWCLFDKIHQRFLKKLMSLVMKKVYFMSLATKECILCHLNKKAYLIFL